jgi:hypothetical protein
MKMVSMPRDPCRSVAEDHLCLPEKLHGLENRFEQHQLFVLYSLGLRRF